jgi:hypothetical protein
MFEQYFSEEKGGRQVLRGEVHDKFFTDLHETLQSQVFEGASLLYQTLDQGGTVEVRLPEPEELIAYIRMQLIDGDILITADFPATSFPEGEAKTYSMQIVYAPPPLESGD